VDAPQPQDILRQIINSLAKGRPADAALLAAGISPAIVTSNATNSHQQSVADQQLQLLPESYNDPRASPENNLKLHKAAFFFKLERELEKV
jgi:CDK inhibitor PHO81